MSSPIALQLEETSIAPGGSIAGRVRLSDQLPADTIAEVRLRGRYRRTVDGGDDVEDVGFEHTISEITGSDIDFQHPAPTGPFSFETPSASLVWELEATALSEDGDQLATDSQVFTLHAGTAKERSADKGTTLEQAGGLPDTFLGNLIGNITSAFGQPTSTEEIHQSLQYVPTGTGPYEREHSLTGNLPIILICLAVGAAAIVGGPRFFSEGPAAVPWVFRGIGVVLFAVGGWTLFTSIRNRMAESAVGEVDFQVAPDKLVRGDAFTASVAFNPDKQIDLNHVHAELKCVKTDKHKGRRPGDRFGHHHDHDHFDDDDDHNSIRTRTYTDTLFSEPIELSGSDSIDIGEQRGFTEIFEIPEDAAHSYRHTTPFWARALPLRGVLISRTIDWVVELHIDIDGWPDWKTEYQCRVYP